LFKILKVVVPLLQTKESVFANIGLAVYKGYVTLSLHPVTASTA
jgi:hypothetical protein